ncbi:MAG: RagB/SusD family nutrient uptake outer membrane protein [Bacteroidetes bacterium]|jgi:hypothetical protein|nr:RagB/SusD family nutrient uptake outer membrane protein [Bacteroidota bacterium]
MKRINKFLFIALLATGLVACENFADLDGVGPDDQVATDGAINDLNSATAGLVGLYNEIQDADLVFDGFLASPQYFSDEAIFTGTFPTRLEFGNFNVFPSNTTMAAFFTDFYDAINSVNYYETVLPTVDDPRLTEGVVNNYLAQARFIRALCYYYLTQGWGDVPLVLDPTEPDEVGDILNVPASSRSDVFDQIITDLEFAAANSTTNDPERASAQAANALLARVYLTIGDYDNAYDLATSVLGEGFDLTNFPYLEDQLFYLSFTTADANSLNFFYGPSGLGGRYSIAPAPQLIAAFEPGDNRLPQAIDTSLIPGTPFCVKYDDFKGIDAGIDPIYFLRHAEMVLIAAEGAAEKGDFDEASMWINQVRSRAGLEDVTLDESNYVDLILQERFVELCLEGGHRLWDLRRRDRDVDVLGPIGYEACDAVWPYPQRDVDRNTNLNQNDCCNC